MSDAESSAFKEENEDLDMTNGRTHRRRRRVTFYVSVPRRRRRRRVSFLAKW